MLFADRDVRLRGRGGGNEVSGSRGFPSTDRSRRSSTDSSEDGFNLNVRELKVRLNTTLQSKMNAKRSPQRFRAWHENGLIKTIQTIPHNLYVSFKLTSLYYG